MDLSLYNIWKSNVPVTMKVLEEMGAVKPSLIEYCQIYDEYIKHRALGYNYTRAVERTAVQLSLTEAKVKVAIAAVL